MSVEILKALARLDAEALDAAANAARRAGVPLADYLSQAAAKKDEVTPADEAGAESEAKKPRTRKPRSRTPKATKAAAEESPSALPETAEDAPTMDLTPISSAIETLSSRLDRSEKRSTMALSGMTDALAALATRIPAQQAPDGGIERSAAFADLANRVDDIFQRLEHADHSRGGDVTALRGLEESIHRLTAHIETRQGETAQTVGALEATVERLASQFASLGTADGPSAATEELAERVFEVAEGLDTIRAKTENMVKRGQLESLEERIEVSVGKTLETALDRVLNEFTLRLEAAEGRSADAIQAVEGQIAGTQDRLAAIEHQLAALPAGSDTSGAAMAASGVLDAFESRLANLESVSGNQQQASSDQFDDLRREFRDLSNRLTDLERVLTAQMTAPAEAPAAIDEEAYNLSVAPQSIDVPENDVVEATSPRFAEAAFGAQDAPQQDDPYPQQEPPAFAQDGQANAFVDPSYHAEEPSYEDRRAQETEVETIPRGGQGLGGGSWRFTEQDEFDDGYEAEPQNRFADQYGARRRLIRSDSLTSNRALVMAASVAVAGAVLVGVFLAMQPSTPSATAVREPLTLPPETAPGTGVGEIQSLSNGYVTPPQSAQDPFGATGQNPSASDGFGTSPSGFAGETTPSYTEPSYNEPSGFDSQPFGTQTAPQPGNGLSDLFDPSAPDGLAPDAGQGFGIPSVADVLTAPTPQAGPPAPAETYGPSPVGIESRTLYGEALGLLRSRGGAEADRRAANLLNQAAQAGLAVAHYRLGTLYQEGRGIPAELSQTERFARARAHYETAARAGNRRAMHNLAVMYASDPANADFPRAAQWFGRAAELGVTDSQFNLAVLFLRGEGIEVNQGEALRWFAIAAAQGDDAAIGHRDELAAALGPQSASVITAASRWSPVPMDPEANGLFYDSEPSQEIVLVQTLLNELGFTAGSADGVLGPRTRDAIRQFEREAGLPQTGSWSPQLVSRLQDARAARSGFSTL